MCVTGELVRTLLVMMNQSVGESNTNTGRVGDIFFCFLDCASNIFFPHEKKNIPTHKVGYGNSGTVGIQRNRLGEITTHVPI